jgi:rhamnose transport system permease protein
MTRLAALLARREAGILTMLVAFIVVVGAIEPRFLTLDSARIVLLAVPLILVGAMGQMMVVVARHVDLSMGSVMGFSAICAGMMFRDHPDLPLVAGFLVAIGAGALLGLVNGLVVVVCNLPSIIVTLGTLSLYRGLLFILSGSRQIDPNQIPTDLIAMAQTSPLGIPWVVLIAFLVAILAHLLLTHSRVGREIYALGSNPMAVRLRGVAVGRVIVLVFILSGAAAGLAGILYAARFGYVNPGITGVGFELTVIAAVVIGGTSINGGVGSVLGTTLGVLLLGSVNVALPTLGISGFWQNAIYGAIILVALIIDRTVREAGLKGLAGRRPGGRA